MSTYDALYAYVRGWLDDGGSDKMEAFHDRWAEQYVTDLIVAIALTDKPISAALRAFLDDSLVKPLFDDDSPEDIAKRNAEDAYRVDKEMVAVIEILRDTGFDTHGMTFDDVVNALQDAYGVNALTPEARDVIQDLAETVTTQMKPEFTEEWLDKPVPLLDERSVLDVARSGDIEALVMVRDYLEGMFT